MKKEEIIFFYEEDKKLQNKLLRDAIDYALMSIPFTFDRLGNRNLSKNILNIAKGKFAENYFYHFCEKNRINLDSKILSTPFYQADKRDFYYDQKEWDLKNNYLLHKNELLDREIYLDQIGLIPNRGLWDQWSKRSKKTLTIAAGTGYVFTFMKKGDPDNGNDFLRISMNLDQKNFMLDLYEKFQGKHQSDSPYEEVFFWDKFFELGPNYNFEISHFPYLVITGIAVQNDFTKFESFKPSDMKSPYLRTIIENMGIPIRNLQSFKTYAGL